MSIAILYWSIISTQILLSIALLPIFWRLIAGPRAQDRIIALDALSAIIMLLFLTFNLQHENNFYFESAFIISFLSGVSTLALGKFLMRGEVIE